MGICPLRLSLHFCAMHVSLQFSPGCVDVALSYTLSDTTVGAHKHENVRWHLQAKYTHIFCQQRCEVEGLQVLQTMRQKWRRRSRSTGHVRRKLWQWFMPLVH